MTTEKQQQANLLQVARDSYVSGMAASRSVDQANDAWHKFTSAVADIMVEHGDQFTFDPATNKKLADAKEKYLIAAAKATGQSESNQSFYQYRMSVVPIVLRFLKKHDIPAQSDAADVEVVTPPPQPIVRAKSRPTVQVIQHDVKVSGSEPAPEPEPLRLQFDESELGPDADDPPPAPTPSPSQATYKKRLANAWRGQVKEIA